MNSSKYFSGILKIFELILSMSQKRRWQGAQDLLQNSRSSSHHWISNLNLTHKKQSRSLHRGKSCLLNLSVIIGTTCYRKETITYLGTHTQKIIIEEVPDLDNFYITFNQKISFGSLRTVHVPATSWIYLTFHFSF